MALDVFQPTTDPDWYPRLEFVALTAPGAGERPVRVKAQYAEVGEVEGGGPPYIGNVSNVTGMAGSKNARYAGSTNEWINVSALDPRAVAIHPDVILSRRPSGAGLASDPRPEDNTQEVIQELRDNGVTVTVTTDVQNASLPDERQAIEPDPMPGPPPEEEEEDGTDSSGDGSDGSSGGDRLKILATVAAIGAMAWRAR